MLTPEQVQFFRDNGYLKVPDAIAPEEIERLREATQKLIDNGAPETATPGERADFQYGRVRGSDAPVLRRIEYVQGKGEAFLHLLAHPRLLDAVEKVVGEQFVPTFDSLVVKMPGNGVEVPWHRDGGGPNLAFTDAAGRVFPSVNFDIYLDEANAQTGALWVVPGSNLDEPSRVNELRERGEYAAVSGAIRVDMEPGDLLLHDTRLYHGSPETHGSALRRVIYYEFRDMRFIEAHHRPADGHENGSQWSPDWTNKRLAVLQHALNLRTLAGLKTPYAAHPNPNLRVLFDENHPEFSTRVSHPGWDENAAKRAA